MRPWRPGPVVTTSLGGAATLVLLGGVGALLAWIFGGPEGAVEVLGFLAVAGGGLAGAGLLVLVIHLLLGGPRGPPPAADVLPRPPEASPHEPD